MVSRSGVGMASDVCDHLVDLMKELNQPGLSQYNCFMCEQKLDADDYDDTPEE